MNEHQRENIIRKFQAPMYEKKSSSTNSLFVGSTINNPNAKSILRTVSSFLFSMLKTDSDIVILMMKHRDCCYFCEEKYKIENPEDDTETVPSSVPPTKEDIIYFITALYDSAQFSHECCIVSAIYITRLLSHLPKFAFHSSNWRPLVFISIIIAQKVFII